VTPGGYDPDLFAGAAEYYARYRVPYPPSAIAYIAESFALDRGCRALDLGCGPGTLAIPLGAIVGEVTAMDPDPGMLWTGRRLAKEAGVGNIRWIAGGSRDLAQARGPFRLAAMGQSFHWMDRHQVLEDLRGLIEPAGGIALVAPAARRPQESWEEAADEVVRRFLGEPATHPQRNPEPRHEPALDRSEYEIVARREFPSTVERDFASILGALYSMSGSARRLFGDEGPRFETELREAMGELNPAGVFREKVETEVVIARLRTKPRPASYSQ